MGRRKKHQTKEKRNGAIKEYLQLAREASPQIQRILDEAKGKEPKVRLIQPAKEGEIDALVIDGTKEDQTDPLELLALLKETEAQCLEALDKKNIIVPWPLRNWTQNFKNFTTYVAELARWTPLRIKAAEQFGQPWPKIETDRDKAVAQQAKQQQLPNSMDSELDDEQMSWWEAHMGERPRMGTMGGTIPTYSSLPVKNPTISAPEGHSGVEHVIS